MCIPEDHGGMGLDTPSWIRVLEEVAKGCTATAMTLHMDSTVQRFIVALGTPEQKSRYFPEVVEREKLFGSWGSEPGVSLGRALLMETTTTPMENGFNSDPQPPGWLWTWRTGSHPLMTSCPKT